MAGASAALERLTLRELHDLHAKLLLAVVRAHGVPAAMHLVGSSLQTLAASAQLTASAGDSRFAFSAVSTDRWHKAARAALQLTDPWLGKPVVQLGTELGVRRQYNQETRTWSAEAVLVRVERDAFARGGMRQCHRLKLLRRRRILRLRVLG